MQRYDRHALLDDVSRIIGFAPHFIEINILIEQIRRLAYNSFTPPPASLPLSVGCKCVSSAEDGEVRQGAAIRIECFYVTYDDDMCNAR
jgi:hypothetical protein